MDMTVSINLGSFFVRVLRLLYSLRGNCRVPLKGFGGPFWLV